jgi:outer membrane protein
MSPTRHSLTPSALLLLIIATLCLSPVFLCAATDDYFAQLVSKLPSDLLALYQRTVDADPDGSVQQRQKLGSIGLLEAVETSMAKSLALTIQEETVNIAEGQYQSQSGAFNCILSGGISYGLNTTKLDSVSQKAAIPFKALNANQTTTSLTLSKQLRTGPTLSLSSQLLRNDYTNDLMATLNETANPETTAIVKLEATIPLLNGAGHLAAATETAAQFTYVAAEYDYLQSISTNTLTVVQRYWDYKTAFFAYDINLAIEGLVRQLLDREKSRSVNQSSLNLDPTHHSIILSTLTAKLSDVSRDTSLARQEITNTRQALALALGIEATNFANLGVPREEFKLDNVSLPKNESTYLNHLTQTAMNHRPDLKSLTLRVRAADLLLDKAKNNLKPHLNLIGNVGYTGLNENSGVDDYISSTIDVKDGEFWTVGVSFSYPLGNQTAKGLLKAQNSTKKIGTLQQDQLIREITSQLTVDIASLKHWASSLNQAKNSVEEYWHAVTIVRQSPLRNNTDLINLLDLQQKLRDAIINLSDAQNGFAKEIALIRFNSGTLVGLADEKSVINLERLTTLP